jgi:hypothetical protein
MCVDSVMCAFGIGKGEATVLVNLVDRLTVLPKVFDAWSTGVLDARRVRVLADATEVLDDANARRVAEAALTWAGEGPWDGPSPRTWRTWVEGAVVYVDPAAAEKRRAAAVAARRVRSWSEGDGSAVLAVHAGDADIALADRACQVFCVRVRFIGRARSGRGRPGRAGRVAPRPDVDQQPGPEVPSPPQRQDPARRANQPERRTRRRTAHRALDPAHRHPGHHVTRATTRRRALPGTHGRLTPTHADTRGKLTPAAG